MVWVGGTRRVRRGGWYPPPGYDPYGRRRGGGGCLRDLFFVETGCCLAESLGCGPQLVLLAPALGRVALQARDGRLQRMVRLYQQRVSAHRGPSCRMTPTCSHYALEALQTHGTVRGLRLTVGRLLRCRPGGPTGHDPVPVTT
jgi:putative membrane protein insertion efficiency factor